MNWKLFALGVFFAIGYSTVIGYILANGIGALIGLMLSTIVCFATFLYVLFSDFLLPKTFASTSREWATVRSLNFPIRVGRRLKRLKSERR